MDVAPSIKYVGNVKKAEKLLGYGDQVMFILERLMTFQNLDQYSITMAPYPGAEIKCSKVFGLRKIEINVPITNEFEVQCSRQCLCNWNFSTGWVLKIKEDQLFGFIPVYDLMICHLHSFYILVENVIASDFTKYEQYQKIIVMPYNAMAFKNKETVPPEPTGCNPKKSEYELDSDSWRTTVRIIPWCGISLSRYVNVENNFKRTQK